MPARIPLDPVLPKNFDCTPNEKRSKAQLDVWWDHPYGVTQPDIRSYRRIAIYQVSSNI